MSSLSDIHPRVAAILDVGGAEFRAALDATGIPYTVSEVHEVLHEKAPDIAAGAAEQILLLAPSDDEELDDDEAQERFDMVMNAALDSVLAFVRRCFEEFGPPDEAALEATLDRSTLALLSRLQTLSNTMSAGGNA